MPLQGQATTDSARYPMRLCMALAKTMLMKESWQLAVEDLQQLPEQDDAEMAEVTHRVREL